MSHSIFHYSLKWRASGFFPREERLEAEDPISSSLFVLAMDLVSQELHSAFILDLFKPHPLCIDPIITHLSSVDDIFLLFDGLRLHMRGSFFTGPILPCFRPQTQHSHVTSLLGWLQSEFSAWTVHHL